MKNKILIALGIVVVVVAVAVWFTMFRSLGDNPTMKSQYSKNFSETFVKYSNLLVKECVIFDKIVDEGLSYTDTSYTEDFQKYFDTYGKTSDSDQQEIIKAIKTYYQDFLLYNMSIQFSELQQQRKDTGESNITNEELQKALAEDKKATKEQAEKLQTDIKVLQKYFK